MKRLVLILVVAGLVTAGFTGVASAQTPLPQLRHVETWYQNRLQAELLIEKQFIDQLPKLGLKGLKVTFISLDPLSEVRGFGSQQGSKSDPKYLRKSGVVFLINPRTLQYSNCPGCNNHEASLLITLSGRPESIFWQIEAIYDQKVVGDEDETILYREWIRP